MKISKHASARMKERTEYNHRDRKRMFREALDKGESVKEIKDEGIKQYLSSKQRINSRVKLYKGYVYVYSKNSKQLYTMYKLPSDLTNSV